MSGLGRFKESVVESVRDTLCRHPHTSRVQNVLRLVGEHSGKIIIDQHTQIDIDSLSFRRDIAWLESQELITISVPGSKAGLNYRLVNTTYAADIFLDYARIPAQSVCEDPLEHPQLWLPGLDPHDKMDERCNLCPLAARFAAIYFRFGSPYTKSDEVDPEHIGRDSVLDDSPTIYGCCVDHLISTIRALAENPLESEYETIPDIVVSGIGAVQHDLYRDVCHDCYGEVIPPDWNLAKDCSYGKETIDELWAREKWRWIT
jgi:hypothetical protein